MNTNAALIILETLIAVKKITAKDKKTELIIIKSDSVNLHAVAMYSNIY